MISSRPLSWQLGKVNLSALVALSPILGLGLAGGHLTVEAGWMFFGAPRMFVLMFNAQRCVTKLLIPRILRGLPDVLWGCRGEPGCLPCCGTLGRLLYAWTSVHLSWFPDF